MQTATHRVEVADILRGFAIMTIFLLHSIEHFNFYSFPDATNEFIRFTDKVVWDSLFFAFAGKAYAIFALLFGFSFYIQEASQSALGNDFRPRFAWRLVLLFVIGNLNAIFFTAEVLVLYALVGFTIIPICRLKSRTILIIATICLLQPVEIGKVVYALLNPDYVCGESLDGPFWAATSKMQVEGNFWQMMKVNLWEGQLASLGWALENGRAFQTAGLFMLGMVMGRYSLLDGSEKHLKLTVKLMLTSLLLFFPLYGLCNILPSFVENQALLKPLMLTLSSLHKFAFMVFWVTAIVWLYYNGGAAKRALVKLVPYGRMSLTNYVTQSIIGSFIFYGWGLGMHRYMGITYSFSLGILLFLAQYAFSVWWLKHHRQGILEYWWKRATWINRN